MLADALALPLALWAAVSLRHGEPYLAVATYWWLFPVAAITGILAFYRGGLYRAIIRYIGADSIIPILEGVSVAAASVALAAYFGGATGFPRTATIIFWFVAVAMVGGGRVAARAYLRGWLHGWLRKQQSRTPVAIYGTGETAIRLARAFLDSKDYTPVAFLDDDPKQSGNTVLGIQVHSTRQLDTLVPKLRIKRILVAIPSVSRAQRRRVLNKLVTLPVEVNIVPPIEDLVAGASEVEVRPVEWGDLLGREIVPPDNAMMTEAIAGKNILVTGAAGTIGSELCRKLMDNKPGCLVLYDNAEHGLYQLEAELSGFGSEGIQLVPVLGSILNLEQLTEVLNSYAINTVYHAAAYKHVPLVERNVVEGVSNNVLGTWRVAKAVAASKAKNLVMVSTDKAVQPTSVMGASKRLAELVMQGFAEKAQANQQDKQYCVVRFGNVLRSSGSVVPLFEQQIQQGGPVTVTHPDTTRYFMTCDEAAELVIQAGALSKGGEIFVLDMGSPISILELAEKMIHLSGKAVASAEAVETGKESSDKIAIEYIGLRPGENLHEELGIDSNATGTKHPKILCTSAASISWQQLEALNIALQTACAQVNHSQVLALVESHVAGYSPAFTTADPTPAAGPPERQTTVTPFKRA